MEGPFLCTSLATGAQSRAVTDVPAHSAAVSLPCVLQHPQHWHFPLQGASLSFPFAHKWSQSNQECQNVPPVPLRDCHWPVLMDLCWLQDWRRNWPNLPKEDFSLFLKTRSVLFTSRSSSCAFKYVILLVKLRKPFQVLAQDIVRGGLKQLFINTNPASLHSCFFLLPPTASLSHTPLLLQSKSLRLTTI